MMIIVAVISFVFILLLSANLKDLVDLATTLSFVIAPVIAYINYRVIMSDQLTAEFRPKPWLKNLAIVGLMFLTVFALIYVGVYFNLIPLNL